MAPSAALAASSASPVSSSAATVSAASRVDPGVDGGERGVEAVDAAEVVSERAKIDAAEVRVGELRRLPPAILAVPRYCHVAA